MIVISNKPVAKENIHVFIDSFELTIVSEMKYLGVIIDENLNFVSHMNYVCKKIGSIISVLGRLRNDLNVSQKLNLYKSLIQLHFMYCASILFLCTMSEIGRLQKLQTKCLRVILRVNETTDVNEMLKRLNLLSVKQLIYFRTLIFIRNIVKGNAPVYLKRKVKYKYEDEIRPLRNSNDLVLVSAMKACSQNSLFHKGFKLYNSMPKLITDENLLEKFKTLLSKYVTENY